MESQYCGGNADSRLEELGGKRLHTLGLGDDSDYIEDDFDALFKSLIELLSSLNNNSEAVSKAEQNTNKGTNTEKNDAKAVSVSVPKKKINSLIWDLFVFADFWLGKQSRLLSSPSCIILQR